LCAWWFALFSPNHARVVAHLFPPPASPLSPRRRRLASTPKTKTKQQQYAKSTDNGARGAVASRQFGKLAKNYDGDTEDFVNFAQQAAQKNLRLQMVRSAREQGK
jgi:hypothetical protein